MNATEIKIENNKLKRLVDQYKQVSGLLPYIDDSTLKGGYRIVKSIQERDAIDCCHRKIGMIVSVKINDDIYKNYRLVGGNPCANNWIEVTSDGAGYETVLKFTVDNDMHLFMEMVTSTSLNFELQDGHLIVSN